MKLVYFVPEFKPNDFSTNVLRSMFGTFEDNETCQKSSTKLDTLETNISPVKFVPTLRIVDKKVAWITCDNLLMKI
jgi:hypothetical protein